LEEKKRKKKLDSKCTIVLEDVGGREVEEEDVLRVEL
jgi:hypothetical protein